MAATNAKATTKKATTPAAKPSTPTASTATAATTRTTTTTAAASSIPTSTATAATNMQQKPAATPTQTPNTGLLPQISLASFLGLPAVIDYQDIAIRVGLVITGIILLILVAWSFVRGKQTTNVNIQASPTTTRQASGKMEQTAEETAEVA